MNQNEFLSNHKHTFRTRCTFQIKSKCYGLSRSNKDFRQIIKHILTVFKDELQKVHVTAKTQC